MGESYDSGVHRRNTIIFVVAIFITGACIMTGLITDVVRDEPDCPKNPKCPSCPALELKPHQKTVEGYPWGKALKRGYVTRVEFQALKGAGWTYLAEIFWHGGGSSWERVSIPMKKHREIYMRGTYPGKKILVVLMDDHGRALSNKGLVVRAEVDGGPPHFHEEAIDMGWAKCHVKFNSEWQQ